MRLNAWVPERMTHRKLARGDLIALLLSLAAVGVSYWIAVRIFEAMPHIEDEIAYVWEAQAMARGKISLPSPPDPKSFLVPFVVDHNGMRFGKYPPGWPALLALGIFFNARTLVNPLLAGLGVWLTYRLGKRIFGPPAGLLAALLTLTSPFFLINSGSLLSHPLGLALSLLFALGWLEAWDDETHQKWRPLAISAVALGLLALTRPLTAVGVALPFAAHGLILFFKKDNSARVRLLVFALIAAVVAGLLFAWQYALTGDPLLNPYTLWWEYDKIGFGPGVGRLEGGHTLNQARINTRFSLWTGWHDLFGWASYSWILLPLGAMAILVKRRWAALLAGGVFPALVLAYTAYWIGSWLFGPRYYYEGLFSLTLLSAAGFAFLAGWPITPDEPWPNDLSRKRLRPLLATAGLALLLSANLVYYTPLRLQSMFGLYGVDRSRLQPFLTAEAQELTPALVVVHANKWTEYGALLELSNPFLDTPFIFTISRGATPDAALADAFPERKLYHYYPDDPWKFYVELK